MRKTYREEHPNGDKSERDIDEAIEETFPASDPPSIGGTTRVIPEVAHRKSAPKEPHTKDR